MRRVLIGLGLLLAAAEVTPTLAQTCVQDYRGRIVCGDRIQPYGGPSYYAPQYGYGPPPGYYRRGKGGPDCYWYHGRRICCPHQWTVQDGVCKPYRGY